MNSRDRQAKLINSINEYTKDIPSSDLILDKMNAEKGVSTAIENGDFSIELLQRLSRLQDAEKGIVWHIKDSPLENGPRILIRDAINAKPIEEVSNLNDQHLWKYQAISTYLTLEKLINNKIKEGIPASDLDKLKQEAKQKILDFCKNLDGLDSKQIKKKIKKLNQEIVEDAYKASKNMEGERLDEQLKYAKDYFAFDVEHFHQVTMYKQKGDDGKKHQIYESSIMLNDLTLEQTVMFQAIAKYEKGKEVKLEHSDLSMAWFNKMPEGKKQLLKEAAANILDGKKSINTQLTDLPLFRNAFLRHTVVDNNLDKALVTNSGAIAVLKSKDKKSLSSLNDHVIDQVKLNVTVEGEKLHVNNLVSPYNKLPGAKDSDVVKYTKSAVKKAGGLYSNSPFNAFRRLFGGGNQNEGQKENLKEIAKIAAGLGCKELQGFLEGSNKNYKQAAKEIDNLNLDSQVKIDLNHALNARKYLNMGFVERALENEQKNINAATVNELKLVNSSINNGALKNLIKEKNIKINVTKYLVLCKSDKDRGGVSKVEESRTHTNDQINPSNDNLIAKENLDAQVVAGHQQNLAGQNLGQNGVKKEVKQSDLPDRNLYNKIHHDTIIRETSSTNKMPSVSRLSKLKIYVAEKIEQIKDKFSSFANKKNNYESIPNVKQAKAVEAHQENPLTAKKVKGFKRTLESSPPSNTPLTQGTHRPRSFSR